MKGCRLETQTKNIKCVIDYPFNSNLDSVYDELCSQGMLFALIVHDKDTNSDGQLKTKHVHLVMKSPKRHQIAYYLNYLSDIFCKVNEKGLHTTNGIEIMLSDSFEWDLQYLIHRNNIDKFQYSVAEIKTNIDKRNLEEMLFTEVHSITGVQDILKAIQYSKNEIELVVKIGIGNYNLYSKFIQKAINQGMLGERIKEEE